MEDEHFEIAGWAPYVSEWDTTFHLPPDWSRLAALTHDLLGIVLGLSLVALGATPLLLGIYIVDTYPVATAFCILIELLLIIGVLRWAALHESDWMKRTHHRAKQHLTLNATGLEIRSGRGARTVPYSALKSVRLVHFPWCLVLRRRSGWPVVLLGRNELRRVAQALQARVKTIRVS